jgi:anaerobic ribonucleoside-triphosphate reductase activating protein
MLKYVENKVVFEEIPDCVTLAVTISNCPFHCVGCHSEYLHQDVGDELNENVIDTLINKNKGVNCFLFLGDGKDICILCELSKYIHEKYPEILTAVYSGWDLILPEYEECFDYIKIGKWKEECGPLNKKTTNQRLYKKIDGELVDITHKFWEKI